MQGYEKDFIQTVRLCNMLIGTDTKLIFYLLVVRVSNPYGPEQDFTRGVGFIDAALKRTLHQEPTEIWGDGENIRDYIFIEDVCHMIGSLLEYSGKDDTFNISSGVGVSQNEIIRMLQKIGLRPQVIYKNKPSVDIRKIILDNNRIRGVWNHQPIVLKDGLRIYYEYLKKTYTGE